MPSNLSASGFEKPYPFSLHQTRLYIFTVSLFFTLSIFAPNKVYAGALEKLFAPKSDLWEYWNQSSESSTRKIDHSEWNTLLNKYLNTDQDGVNKIDYGNISDPDRAILKSYLKKLQQVSIRSYSKKEQKAYWINLYNAATVDTILDHYPVVSIRAINTSPGIFSVGPWGNKNLSVENQKLSLNDIEHRILRPIWNDPRLHYVLNCASIGCPNLAATAFDSNTLESELDKAASDFINHPRAVKFENSNLVVSSIYIWFQVDFGDSDQSVISHLKKYANPELKKKLMDASSIDDDHYDWNLNDTNPYKKPEEIGDY